MYHEKEQLEIPAFVLERVFSSKKNMRITFVVFVASSFCPMDTWRSSSRYYLFLSTTKQATVILPSPVGVCLHCLQITKNLMEETSSKLNHLFDSKMNCVLIITGNYCSFLSPLIFHSINFVQFSKGTTGAINLFHVLAQFYILRLKQVSKLLL